ncbi:DUF2946 family protein [Neorhizobium lilium]|uniref:DUF2946 family protein n=1 Tax=Neorhizobium lilium TaxID=2503024 RepID=UPI001FDFBBDB|nr:DUF2946 family protein [Neorhizobium lilium]
MSRLWKIETWIVQALSVLAILCLGFAHQPPSLGIDDARASDFADYVLPDGTLPTLCLTSAENDSKGSSGHKFHSQGCEVCRIGAAILLPAPTDVSGILVAFVASADLPPRTEAIHRQIYPPNTGPRAPPIDPIMT